MVEILIKTESRYPISRKSIRETVERVLMERRIKGKVELSINVVGDRLMKVMNKNYRGIDDTTDVLSFSLSETKDERLLFVDPPDGKLRLGDILVSYPQAVVDASVEEKMVDQKIAELVEHGLLHLLGYHHE